MQQKPSTFHDFAGPSCSPNSLSKSAIDKIAGDTRIHDELKGRQMRPLLLQYEHCDSTDEAGERIDYGGGFVLHFRSMEEPVEDAYVEVSAAPGSKVWIAPEAHARSGHWRLDYVDRFFVLEPA